MITLTEIPTPAEVKEFHKAVGGTALRRYISPVHDGSLRLMYSLEPTPQGSDRTAISISIGSSDGQPGTIRKPDKAEVLSAIASLTQIHTSQCLEPLPALEQREHILRDRNVVFLTSKGYV